MPALELPRLEQLPDAPFRYRATAIRAAEEGHIRAVRTRLGWLYDPESVEQYRQRRLRRGHGGERESE